MPLQKQVVPVALGQGVDTKTDPKQVVSGKLLALENGRFQATKEIKKRAGTSNYVQTVQGGGSISAGSGLVSYQNELDLLDGQNLYSYSPNEGAWVNQGSLLQTTLSTQTVVRTNNQQTIQDSAYDVATGLRVFVWKDSSLGLCYSVLDSSTGTPLVSEKVVSSTALYGKVLLNGSYFVIVYYESSSNHLVYKSINTATPAVLSSPTTIASDCDLKGTFDCEVIGSNIYVAYSASTTTAIAVYSLSQTLVLSSQFKTSAGLAAFGGLSICVFGDSSDNVWVAFSFGNLGCLVLNSSLSQILAPTTLDSTAPRSSPLKITGYVSGTTATFYYSYLPGGSVSNITPYTAIATTTLTLSGTAGTPTTLVRGLNLASKVFVQNSLPYFFAYYGGNFVTTNSVSTLTSIEPTYFLLNGLGQVVLKLAPGNAGTPSPNSSANPDGSLLPEVVTIGVSQFLFPYLQKYGLSVENGVLFFLSGVSAAVVNLKPAIVPAKADLAKNLHVGLGQVWMYDGANVVEHGFHLYPENLSYTLNPAGFTTGAIGIGSNTNGAQVYQFQYTVVYEWQDNQGQTHRSAPSPALTLKLSAYSGIPVSTGNFSAGSNVITAIGGLSPVSGYQVGQIINNSNLAQNTYITALNVGANTITLSNPALTGATGSSFSTLDNNTVQVNVPTLQVTNKNNVAIVLYRTTCNGTVFYRTTSLTNITYNNTASDFQTLTDTTPDSTLVGNQLLYTNSGEVENTAPPAANIVFSNSKNRIILIPSENPLSWWYSKQVIPDSPVEFSDLFVANVTSRIGQITAIGDMDDKMIFFGPQTKGYVVGTGPAPDGLNNDYSDLILIAGATGCSNPASIVETPDGIMYQSSQGIYLLSRALQEVYVGAEVEAFNEFTVTSALATPGTTQVEFTLNNGQRLVYDYFARQWGVDQLAQEAVDSAIFQNVATYLSPTGLVSATTLVSYTDNGAFIPLSLKTSWLQLSGLQGFQRVWRLNILGEYKSPHTLLVNIYTDFSPTIQQTVSIPVLADPNGYQFSIHIVPQKCEAIQIEIMDQQTASFGEGFSISALTFEAGMKQGTRSLSESKSYG